MPTIKELKIMAQHLEVPGYYKLHKEDLVWAIQTAEGHDACFHRIPDCGIKECLFRPDCLPEE